MADVLKGIVVAKRIDVAARLGQRSADEMRQGVEPTTRSLKAALAQRGARFVMEVKRASPSGHTSTVEPADAARAYAGVADAVSVLTDQPYFGGSLDDLRTVRAIFAGPILAKDFVVDPRQLIEARAAGADAALAMLSVLGDATVREVYAEAARLGMDVITEVHDEEEMARAAALGAGIIGINNRDLKSLTTDLAVTERLAPLAPPGALLISESGIATRCDVQRLAAHVDAFLVGSSLMAAPDVREAARALVFGRVKICGLAREEDVALAAASGATHAGFIFAPNTPRALTEAQARPLVAQAKALGLVPVGVFRDGDPEQILDIVEALGLAAVQLHGNANYATIARIRRDYGGEIWAVSRDGAEPVVDSADRTLFDSGKGGTGQPFDWSLLDGRRDLPKAFLAGGITPDNAAEASRVGAYGLDLSSGVEAQPRYKDPQKMAALFAALRPASRAR
ncbi:MAG: bifunctional indole-3-glycerol-phosphate synthase TrpC/phosphoribosylanthranilate isomerase TrpF [Sphingomicrobium sp.]